MGESHSHWALGSPFLCPSQPVDSKLTKTQMCHWREKVLTSAVCICWRGMRTLNICLWQLGRAGTTTSLYFKPLFRGFYLNQISKPPSSLVWFSKPQHTNAHKHYKPLDSFPLSSCHPANRDVWDYKKAQHKSMSLLLICFRVYSHGLSNDTQEVLPRRLFASCTMLLKQHS